MGNHSVGKAMATGATVALRSNPAPTREQALATLDLLGEPWRGADAEFDGFEDADDLVSLISIAFGVEPPLGTDADDEDGGWYDEVYESFRKRYAFC